ncbi:hypothetical protein HYW40_03040 [Candidatus Curtissbacteria bacterium]|nr:hypothetical protein [Candidatus Curtissbacteria bacterium]
MTATAHALIGASIATQIANPLIGLPLAFVSHFLADLIPHWDAGTSHRQKSSLRLKVESAVDVLLGFTLVYIIFRNLVDPLYLFAMVITAQLPDWLMTPSWMFGIKIPPFTWMDYLSHKLQSRLALPWGLVTQIAIVGLIVAVSLWTTPTGRALASLI